MKVLMQPGVSLRLPVSRNFGLENLRRLARSWGRLTVTTLAALAALLCSKVSFAQVTIPATASVGAVPSTPGTGLAGDFYLSASDITGFVLADGLREALTSNASFVATTVDFPKGAVDTGSSQQSLSAFLGSDAASLNGDGNAIIDRAAFVFRGYIGIVEADDTDPSQSGIQVRFGASSDDGFRLNMGDITVCGCDCTRGFSPTLGVATFTQAGLYPIEVLFWDNLGDQGIELVSSIAGGDAIGGLPGRPLGVPTARLYSSARIKPTTAGGTGVSGSAAAISDGVFQPSGTTATTSNSLTWTSSSSSVELDFSIFYDFTSATIQADGNDGYVLRARPRGQTTYIDLWSIPSLAQTGLRTRPNDSDVTVRQPVSTTRARYARVVATPGVQPYAFSELVMFGRRFRLEGDATAPGGFVRTWGGPNGSFNLASNWVGGTAPRTSDTAAFAASDAATTYAVSLAQAAEVYGLAARRGFTTMNLGGNLLAVTGNLDVGVDSAGTNYAGKLTLQNGRVEAVGLRVGFGNAPSSGRLVVDGATLIKQNCCDTVVGMLAGNSGELSVLANGLVELGQGTHSIGREGGIGTALLDTGGQLLATNGRLSVGNAATGSLTIRGPSSLVDVDSDLRVGHEGGGSGTMTVEGGLAAGRQVLVGGFRGAGTATVTQGGRIQADDRVIIGHFRDTPSAVGEVTVDGAGSTLLAGGLLQVAVDGAFGTLSLRNGASATVLGTQIGLQRNFLNNRGLGTLALQGKGTTLNSGFMYLGFEDGLGSGSVSALARVNVTNELSIGDLRGTGTFEVNTAGRVSASTAFVGRRDAGTGSLIVDGAFAEFVGLTGVGVQGSAQPSIGEVTVRAGARLSSSTPAGNPQDALIGGGGVSGCLGTVRVTGESSRWDGLSTLSIGGADDLSARGRGVVEVSAGGRLTAQTVLVGSRTENSGELSVDGIGTLVEIADRVSLSAENGSESGASKLVLRNGGRVSTGSLVCGPRATIEVVVDGTGLPALVVSGEASLGGALSVSLAPGYQLPKGQSITLFSAGSVVGNFAQISLPQGLEAELVGGQFVVRRPAVPVALVLTPASLDLPIGFEQPIEARLNYSDGSFVLVTTSATWTSSQPAKVSVDASGRVRAIATGNAIVTAAFSGFVGSTQVAVLSSAQYSTCELISVTATGVQASNPFYSETLDRIDITQDGSKVLFGMSGGPGALLPQSPNAFVAFVKDRLTGELRTVNCQPDFTSEVGIGMWASMGADGRYFAFVRENQTPPGLDLYAQDCSANITDWISRPFPGEPIPVSRSTLGSQISVDGAVVAFLSDSADLVEGAPQHSGVVGENYLYVRDRLTNQTRILRGIDGQIPNQTSPSYDVLDLTPNGRYLTFTSGATNLVANDTNGEWDAFVVDLLTDTIERVSISSAGGQLNGGSYYPAISDDGSRIAFRSVAPNAHPGGLASEQIYLRDRELGSTRILTLRSNGEPFNGTFVRGLSMSGNGRFIAFRTDAQLVPQDQNQGSDVYRLSVATGQIDLVSASALTGLAVGDATWSALNRDGSVIVFRSASSALAPFDFNGTNDIFARVIPVPPIQDCDDDGRTDAEEIANGAVDCDGNGVPDSCQLAANPNLDSNGNGTLDFCEGLSVWVGGASGSFSSASNWSGGVPGPQTTVVLSPPVGSTIEITTGTSPVTVRSMRLERGALRLSLGSNLRLLEGFTVNPGAAFLVNGLGGTRVLEAFGDCRIRGGAKLEIGKQAVVRALSPSNFVAESLSNISIVLRETSEVPLELLGNAQMRGGLVAKLGDLAATGLDVGVRYTLVTASNIDGGYYSALSAQGLATRFLKVVADENSLAGSLVLEVSSLDEFLRSVGSTNSNIGVGEEPTAIAAKNFTTSFDAFDDIAVTVRITAANGTPLPGNLYVFKGNDGVNGAQAVYATDLEPIAVESDDVTGDGKFDIVVLNRASGSLQVFRNGNDTVSGFDLVDTETVDIGATYLALSPLFNAASMNPAAVGFAFLASNPGGGTIRPGKIVGGTVTPFPTIPVPTSPGPVSPIDDTGREEGAFMATRSASAGDEFGAVFKVEVSGNGLALPGESVPGPSRPIAIETGNLNADGFADMVVAGLSGAGSGSLPTATVYPGAQTGFGEGGAIPLTKSPLGLAIGDFDADGKQDFAVALGTEVGGAEQGEFVRRFNNVTEGASNPVFESGANDVLFDGQGVRRIRRADLDATGPDDYAVLGETITTLNFNSGAVPRGFAGQRIFELTTEPACPGDVDGDGAVNGNDLALLLVSWGGDGAADFDGSEVVDGTDLTVILSNWGTCGAVN